MTLDPTVVPGLLLLALELLALAAVGYGVARVALRQDDHLMALAQGLAIGIALWGLTASLVLHAVPGRAGALLTWVLLLAPSLWLGWRRRRELPINRTAAASFAAASLSVFAVALAARQTLIVSDAFIRFGLAAPIQAGVWPPILPWSPWQPVPYHYGTDMLVGLLAPPAGPDLAFTKELLDAAAWTSLAMLVGVTVLQRGGWTSLFLLVPLLLSAGVWIQLQGTSPALLQLPMPGGTPDAGIRASISDVYWPMREWPWPYPEPHAAPPNIWFLRFTLGYALALTILERMTQSTQALPWRSALTLAALVGFLGLVEEALALTILGLWGLIEITRLVRARPDRTRTLVRAAAGVVSAGLLLAFGGGVLTGLLTGPAGGNVTIGWAADSARLRPLALADFRPGGVALLGLGPAILAGTAILLGVRQRLVIALGAGAGVLLFAALTLGYESAPRNVARLDAHAGNFALFGLLVAAAVRLRTAKPRWRYPICALVGVVIVWPTVALPVRTLAFQVSHGFELANAQPDPRGRDIALYSAGIGRQTVQRLTPSQVVNYMPSPPPPLHTRPTGVLAHDQVVRYIQEQTPGDARILSPHPSELTLATGRPNASGFAGYLHYVERAGPEYEDARRFLEPAAVGRLGFTYVHATNAWIETLPARAKSWLNDPSLFEPLVREGSHTLYRIQPAFMRLDPIPAPQSYEALRQAIPRSATVYLTAGLQRLNKLRMASVLSHTKLSGTLDTSRLHLLPGLPIEPPGTWDSDVIIVARDLALGVANHGYPAVWWDPDSIAYATAPSIAPAVVPPPAAAPDFAVRLSGVRTGVSHVTFWATFTDNAPTRWTGQDWLVLEVENTPWATPIQYEDDGYTLVGTQWYPGQVGPSGRTETRRYRFDALAGTMTIQDAVDDQARVHESANGLRPGVWVLAVRLREDYLQAAVIPALKVVVSESGQVTYTAYSGERGAALNPCPERMQHTDACRKLLSSVASASS